MFHVESANLYMRQLESKKTTKDSKKWTPIHMSLDGIFLYDGKKVWDMRHQYSNLTKK